jgi:hypothetical protein
MMKTNGSGGMLVGAICLAVACALQIVGLIRYVGRLPADWVGIGLYIASIIAFAVAALAFYIRSRR